VHVAESLPRGALDLVEYAFRSSASLSVGLARLARYAGVMSDRVASRMEATGDGLLLLVRDTGGTVLHPSRAEFALAIVLKLARDTTGAAITPAQVSFAHPPPGDFSEHQRFFRRRVTFNAGSNSMLLRPADAALPLVDADEALSEIVRRRLEKALASRARFGGETLAARVRRLLVEGFGHGALTPTAVARSLSISRRTLTRHLAGERTSFSAIRDEVRAELASALLQDRSLSIGDIAFFLQYSEPAAFHRAFRRWTGKTPQAFRRG
jgi:AraC-like DNA-binding protein